MNDKEIEKLAEEIEETIGAEWCNTARKSDLPWEFHIKAAARNGAIAMAKALMSKTAPQNDISEGVMSNESLNKSTDTVVLTGCGLRIHQKSNQRSKL